MLHNKRPEDSILLLFVRRIDQGSRKGAFQGGFSMRGCVDVRENQYSSSPNVDISYFALFAFILSPSRHSAARTRSFKERSSSDTTV